MGMAIMALLLEVWEPVTTAPFGRNLQLAVLEHGQAHVLVFPCRRTPEGWIDPATRCRIDIGVRLTTSSSCPPSINFMLK